MQKINYQNVRKRGRRVYAHRWLILVAAPNSVKNSRYGWTMPRYVGGAVLRNKYKRWLREILRQHAQSPAGHRAAAWDINFIFKKMNNSCYKDINFTQFKNEIKKALRYVDKNNKK